MPVISVEYDTSGNNFLLDFNINHISSARIALLIKYPCTSSQPLERKKSNCRMVSTPSAVTLQVKQVTHCDDGSNNAGVIRGFVDVPNKRLVYF